MRSPWNVGIALLAALAAAGVPGAPDWLDGTCSRSKELAGFARKLSVNASIYFPGSGGFEEATRRWSNLEPPKPDMAVRVGNEGDVAETIKFANSKDVPFLAYNTGHGALTTLGRMNHGIGIILDQLSDVSVAADGASATIGGGTSSKAVTDALWVLGKQTVTGTCECVSYVGPLLGGGHGWLQGRHGLIADQVLSFNIVLANGCLEKVTPDHDLWWALRGAGHNFGVITSVTSKVYDIVHTDWAIETLVFRGEIVQEVYETINIHYIRNGSQPVDLVNWSYWFNNPAVDPTGPIIEVYILQEGVRSVSSEYTNPLRALNPVAVRAQSGTYRDLAGWVNIALDSIPCQKLGLSNPRFPIYAHAYNSTAVGRAYDLFKEATLTEADFFNSLFLFEGYPTAGVKAIDGTSSAFAFRADNLLMAPLITYNGTGPGMDERAGKVGNELRNILQAGTGREEMHTYVNYAFGDEEPERWYGFRPWRTEKLRALKRRYDPECKFCFYAPIRL